MVSLTKSCKILYVCLSMLMLFLGTAAPSLAVVEAYFPSEHNLSLPNYPPLEDTRLELFIDEFSHLFVLNVKAKTVYHMSLDGKVLSERHLELPEDIAPTEATMWVSKGRIYLKLPEDALVWQFDRMGRLERKITLNYPQSPGRFMGLAVDPRGYLYVMDISKGSVEVFQSNGVYVGCFVKVGSREDSLMGLPQYITMDNEGNLHVAVRLPGNDAGEIAKYNYQGRLEQRFKDIPRFYSKITVDKLGNVFAIEPSSLSLVKFDRRGRMICRFKTRPIQSLSVDADGALYLENASNGLVEVLLPSEMVRWVDQGNNAFLEDDWETAERYYQQALRLDNQMDFVHLALGEVYFQQRRFVHAMKEFKLIEDRWRYSQALYGFRWFLINNYWPHITLFIVVLTALIVTFRKRLKSFIMEHMAFSAMIWAPRKTLLDQTAKPNIYRSLSIILIFSVVAYLSWYITNPIFIGDKQVFSFQLFSWRLFLISLLIVLWAWTGYKVGELFQGMAKNIQVFLSGTALCLFPAIVLLPIIALASHVLTYDELWIYQWAGRMLVLWIMILMIMKIRLTEDFTWGKALGIGMLNLGATTMILCFLGFLVGINQQVFSFIQDVYREVYNRIVS